MRASIVDLRYRMKQVLSALNRRERVTILYHGQAKGTIVPTSEPSHRPVCEHPFFGSRRRDGRSVNEIMEALRGGRYRAR